MSNVQPLFLPEHLIAAHAILLENDFPFQPVTFCFGPQGDCFVLSKLEYNYFRYDDTDKRGSFQCYVINAFGPDGSLSAIAEFSKLYERFNAPGQDNWDQFDPYLWVSPQNMVVLSTQANRCFLFDAAMERELGSYASFGKKAELHEVNFAYQIESAPDGRILCLVGEPGLHTAHFSSNLVCISDGTALTAGHRPNLACIACLKFRLEYESNSRFPYVRLPNGAAAGAGNRPEPSLEQQAKDTLGVSLNRPWIGQVLPLGSETCVVSVYNGQMRGGSKGLPFVFGLLRYDGRLIGKLDGIDEYEESPFVEYHFRLAVDHRHHRIIYKNKFAFYLFDFEGRLIEKVMLDGADVKAASPMRLGCCGPTGQIVLYHPKQSLMLTIDPFEQSSDLRQALTASLVDYSTGRKNLKKAFDPVNYRWISPQDAQRH